MKWIRSSELGEETKGPIYLFSWRVLHVEHSVWLGKVSLFTSSSSGAGLWSKPEHTAADDGDQRQQRCQALLAVTDTRAAHWPQDTWERDNHDHTLTVTTVYWLEASGRIKSTHRAAGQFLTSLVPSTSVSGVHTCKRRRWRWGQNVRGRLHQLRWRWCRLCDEGVNLLRVERAVFADVSIGEGGVGFWCAGITVDTWTVIRADPSPWGTAAQPLTSDLFNSDSLDRIFHFNLPDCPSTQVLVVVTVRCLRRDSSRLVNRAASVSVLLSQTMPLLTGVFTAEKERAFLGVAAWLSDKDRPPEVDCCFLLRNVLRAQAGRKDGSYTAGMSRLPSGRAWIICVVTPTSSLSWCSDSGSSQQHSHGDRCDPVGAGFAATFWVIRTQQRSGAPAQTPGQL